MINISPYLFHYRPSTDSSALFEDDIINKGYL